MSPEEINNAEVQIELSIDQAKEFLDKSEALRRLERNEDFKKLIIEGYLEKEAVRLVGLLMDSEMQEDLEKDLINKELYGISSMRLYLRNVHLIAAQMKNQVARSEEVLEELRKQDD